MLGSQRKPSTERPSAEFVERARYLQEVSKLSQPSYTPYCASVCRSTAIGAGNGTDVGTDGAEGSSPLSGGHCASGVGLVRAYTVWPSRNEFCCCGHCMTGPREDCAPNACAWATTLCPMALFFIAWGQVLLHSSPGYLVLVLVSFGSTLFWFAVTSFTDPGIIPRGEPPEKMPPLHRTRTLSDGRKVTETWCVTCHIYRPDGASHCRDCDNCVREFDHHCPFTRNCIGARNYAPFVLFLVSVCLSLAVLFVSCLVVLPSAVSPSGEVVGVEVNGALNALLIVFSIALSLFLWAFTGYHLTLILSGLTTKEHLKGRTHGRRPLCQRLCNCACFAFTPSQIEPRKLVPRPVPIITVDQL